MGCTVPRCWVDQAAWVPGGSHHAKVASPELGSRVGCGSPRKSSRQAGQARLGQVRPRMLVSHRILKKGKQGKQALPVLRPPFPPPFPNCFSFRAGPFASRILHLLTSRILHLLTAPRRNHHGSGSSPPLSSPAHQAVKFFLLLQPQLCGLPPASQPSVPSLLAPWPHPQGTRHTLKPHRLRKRQSRWGAAPCPGERAALRPCCLGEGSSAESPTAQPLPDLFWGPYSLQDSVLLEQVCPDSPPPPPSTLLPTGLRAHASTLGRGSGPEERFSGCRTPPEKGAPPSGLICPVSHLLVVIREPPGKSPSVIF